MKILVTGSSGFIGTHLVKALTENSDEVLTFDIRSSPLQSINDPLAIQRVIKKHRPTVIIHLAALSNRKDVVTDPDLAMRTNILGTFNILRIAHKAQIRTIVASSAAVEEPKLSLYGTTKQSVEQLVELFPYAYAARFFNVYGQGGAGAVNQFVTAVKADKPIILNGDAVRDYIHVDDVVRALQQLAQDETIPEKITYVGTGVGTSLHQLIAAIEKQSGKKANIMESEAIKEIQRSVCNVLLIDFYTIPLEEGIKRLWQDT